MSRVCDRCPGKVALLAMPLLVEATGATPVVGDVVDHPDASQRLTLAFDYGDRPITDVLADRPAEDEL